jgi:RimJ/RimL family protein N-acetyltransferase
LTNFDWINSTAAISVVIYAKNCWGRGYGYDTVKTLTSYGLLELNLHTIYLTVFEDNDKAVKCFEKAGYEREGILRSRIFKDGEYRNIVSMSISRDKSQEV